MGILRKRRGVSFVRRAPTKSGQDVPIHVAKMTFAHVRWWHSHVQPIIDRDPNRADYGWNWLLYVPFAEVTGRVLTRRPLGYTIGLSDPERDRFVPCALVQLLGRVPALDDHDREGVFVWFLSTAPDEAKLPPGPRRLLKPSDGRYCYYTVPAAVEASKELDSLR